MNRTLTAILLATALMASACGISSNVFATLDEQYTRVTGTGTSTPASFYSAAGVSATSTVVQGAARPNDTITNPEGEFLQYSDIIVAIYDCATPAGAGSGDENIRTDGTSACQGSTGSAIYIDSYSRGRSRWFPIIASRWGTSASGRSFRGGGSSGGTGSGGGK